MYVYKDLQFLPDPAQNHTKMGWISGFRISNTDNRLKFYSNKIMLCEVGWHYIVLKKNTTEYI